MNDNEDKTTLAQSNCSSENQSPPPSVLKQFALRLFPNFFSDSNPSLNQRNESASSIQTEKTISQFPQGPINKTPKSPTSPNHVSIRKARLHTNSVIGYISPKKFQMKKLDEDESPILRRKSRGYSFSPKNHNHAENEMIKRSVRKKSKANEDLNEFQKELVANERVIAFKTCSLMPPSPQSQLSPINGSVIITNFRMVFKPCHADRQKIGSSRANYFEIFAGSILKLERSRDKTKSDFVYLDIYSQNDFIFNFQIREDKQGGAGFFLHYLDNYSLPAQKDHLFAFEHFKAPQIKQLEKHYKGSKIYDIEKEFERQGIAFESFNEKKNTGLYPHKLIDNRLGQICASYPPLLLVPTKITSQETLNSSKFRNRDRIPVITYYCCKTGAILARSSQPRGHIIDDQLTDDNIFLQYLENPYSNTIETNPFTAPNQSEKSNFYICSTQSFSRLQDTNFMRRLRGLEIYKNNKVYQVEMEDIHYVRHAHKRLIDLCSNIDSPNFRWYSQLESSKWIKDISKLILASRKIASLLKRGKNCLVECSNGSDRSSQLVSLAQIIADPYYRTIEGFEVLISKDWIYFGHQFYTRNGAEINQNDSKKSPIFLEFLDCVYQLTNQYPFAFEFNNRFVLEIARHIYSRQFGTFLADSYQELNLYKLEDKTLSLWSYLNSTKEKFLNPYYKSFADRDWFLLRPGNHLKYMKLWEEYFLKHSWIPKPAFEMADNDEVSFYQSDFYENISIQKSNEVQDLKNKLEKLKDKVAKLQEMQRKKEDDVQSRSSESEQGSRFFERLSVGSQDPNTRLSKSIEDEFADDNQNNNKDYEFHFHET